MKLQIWLASCLVALGLLAMPKPALADDTDIYYSNEGTAGTALVMFSIDYRANLTSSDGSGYTLFSTYHALESDAADYAQLRTAALAVGSANWQLFDTIRFALWAVLTKYSDAGLSIGLMINHNNDNNCAGPTQSGCSNGGVIMMGFRLVTSADNYAARTAFLSKLSALRGLKAASNSADHPYQGAELFFEFYRYLTGGHVYNGHNGWKDFEQGGGVDTTTNDNPCSVKGSFNNKCAYDRNSNGLGSGPDAAWDPDIENTETPTHRYISPLGANACAKVFTINFMFEVSQSEADSITAMQQTTANEGLGSSVSSGGQNNYFPNTLAILYQSDLSSSATGTQNVTSYFFVDSTKINTTTTGYASSGGTTTPYPLDTNDASGLEDDLDKIFSDVLSVSTTFVATAVPANVFNRTQSLDRLYIALFKAGTNSAGDQIVPFWNGDVKKLRLINGIVKDANNNVAINAVDGRISTNSVTYWTKVSTLDGTCFGTTSPCVSNDPTAYVTTDATATSDGRQVNRGGAGQMIPGYHTGRSNDPTTTSSPEWTNTSTPAVSTNPPRQVLYDPATIASGGSTLSPLNVNNSYTGATETDLCTASVLGVTAGLPAAGPFTTANPACEKLLMFMRGLDTPSSIVTAANMTSYYTSNPHPPSRKWLMSDPLHSRPLGINYGAVAVGSGTTYTGTNGSGVTTSQTFSSSNPGIFIAVAGNDGALHMIQDTDNSGNQVGKELWAFIPRKAMGLNPQGRYLQQDLMDNVVGTNHTYGLDGAPVVYVQDINGDGTVNGSDTVTVVIGMRRGGYSYYGLDVTNPAVPRIKWRIDNSMTDFAELGMTFSTPQVGFLNYNGAKRAVLFFGGGFDTNKDTDGMGTNDTQGRAIYAVLASSGQLIWKAVYNATSTTPGSDGTGTATKAVYSRSDMTNSIPSDVAILDSNNDGYTDRLVVGDTGGNVWRADFAGSDARKWSVTLVAKLGRHGTAGTATKPDDRRFFYPPEIVQTTTASSGGSSYDGILIGSGDREDPRDFGGVTTNYFFNVRDTRTGIMSTDGSAATTTVAADMSCGGHTCTTADLTDLTDNCLQGEGTDAASQTTAQSACNEIITYGWKTGLTHTPGSEKSLATPLVVNGVVFFTTYSPGGTDGTSCGPAEGTGHQYAINVLDATAAFNLNQNGDDRSSDLNTGGIPASDVLINSTPGVTYDPNQSGSVPCDCIYKPSNECLCVNATSQGRTFWQRQEQIPQ